MSLDLQQYIRFEAVLPGNASIRYMQFNEFQSRIHAEIFIHAHTHMTYVHKYILRVLYYINYLNNFRD